LLYMKTALLCLGLFFLIANSFFIEASDDKAIRRCKDRHCSVCFSSPKVCDACKQDYYEVKSEGRCKTCANAIDHCSMCSQPSVHDPITCTKCEVSYYYRDNTCINCYNSIYYCLNCSQPTTTDNITCS